MAARVGVDARGVSDTLSLAALLRRLNDVLRRLNRRRSTSFKPGARCDAARGCCGSGGRRRTRRGPKVSIVYLLPFTTTLAGSRAGARCDAARGCCCGRGRRRTRRGPKVSTVCLFPLLLLSLAPELARAATRREAAAAAESGSGACTARRAVLPPLHKERHAQQRPAHAAQRRTAAICRRRAAPAPPPAVAHAAARRRRVTAAARAIAPAGGNLPRPQRCRRILRWRRGRRGAIAATDAD